MCQGERLGRRLSERGIQKEQRQYNVLLLLFLSAPWQVEVVVLAVLDHIPVPATEEQAEDWEAEARDVERGAAVGAPAAAAEGGGAERQQLKAA